jgi:hypothetical protein
MGSIIMNRAVTELFGQFLENPFSETLRDSEGTKEGREVKPRPSRITLASLAVRYLILTYLPYHHHGHGKALAAAA